MRLWIMSACLTTATTLLLILMALGPTVEAQPRVITSQADVDLARLSEKASNVETAIATLTRKVEKNDEKIDAQGKDSARLEGRMQGFGAALVALQLLHLGVLIFGIRRKEH